MPKKRRVFQYSKTTNHPLREQIDLDHPLVVLASQIDWQAIDDIASAPFSAGPGRPQLRSRLITGLRYLQHAFGLSDDQVVAGWVENPYWQVFTGEIHLQTAPPIDPSSLSRGRKRLGEAGIEELLAQSIEAAKKARVVTHSSLKQVIADTTVMDKAIAHPTDTALLERSRQHLVKAAHRCGLRLRQNYNREAPRLARQAGRYSHARQFKRMCGAVRTMRSRVGRVHRNIARQWNQVPLCQRDHVDELLSRTGRILTQQPKDKNKLS